MCGVCEHGRWSLGEQKPGSVWLPPVRKNPGACRHRQRGVEDEPCWYLLIRPSEPEWAAKQKAENRQGHRCPWPEDPGVWGGRGGAGFVWPLAEQPGVCQRLFPLQPRSFTALQRAGLKKRLSSGPGSTTNAAEAWDKIQEGVSNPTLDPQRGPENLNEILDRLF